MYQEGISQRNIGLILLEEGVPSPDTPTPWSNSCISVIVAEYKQKNTPA